MVESHGTVDIRGENVQRAVTGFALKKFKLKPLLLTTSSSKWTETYYKETATILSAGGTRNIKEIGRLSQFPSVEPTWTKVSAPHLKYAAKGIVSMEDKLTDAIDVQARTLFRIAESVANSVDAAIYAKLTAEVGTAGTVAAVAKWDAVTVSSRDPIQDILRGIQAMDESNYDALEGGHLLINPHDYASLMMNSKVINNPSFKTADVVSNGRVGQIAGLTIVKTTSVTDDEAMIIISQRSAAWKTAVALTTAVIEDKGIKFEIRAWEIGQIQIPNPKAIYTITGTKT